MMSWEIVCNLHLLFVQNLNQTNLKAKRRMMQQHEGHVYADKRCPLVMQMFLFSFGLFIKDTNKDIMAPPASLALVKKKKKYRPSQVHAGPTPACSGVKFWQNDQV